MKFYSVEVDHENMVFESFEKCLEWLDNHYKDTQSPHRNCVIICECEFINGILTDNIRENWTYYNDGELHYKHEKIER